jgi:hypothetical protein
MAAMTMTMTAPVPSILERIKTSTVDTLLTHICRCWWSEHRSDLRRSTTKTFFDAPHSKGYPHLVAAHYWNKTPRGLEIAGSGARVVRHMERYIYCIVWRVSNNPLPVSSFNTANNPHHYHHVHNPHRRSA